MKKVLCFALCILIVCVGVSAVEYEGYSQDEFIALEKTTVIRSDDSPTGYYVTFRYKDAEASRVRLYGEWAFSDIEHASFFTSLNASPDEWQDGYTVWKTTSWPTVDMVKDEKSGIWSYTIPLPTGTWCYCFYVGGAEGAELTDYTDAVMVADPANINYLANSDEVGREQLLTAVYVPKDEEKQAKTISRYEEAPRDDQNGSVVYETVTLDNGITTTYAVYLPYEFDANREEAYPIMVLFHGGGGYYGSWFTNGLVNILDNMIAEGRMKPAIVVTPNGSDFPHEQFRWDRPIILDYVVNTILPKMEQKYNASSNPKDRVYAGLSMGGATAAHGMFHATDLFDSFILLSAPLLGDLEPDYSKPELKEKNIYIGYGDYDFVVVRSLYHYVMGEDGMPKLLVNRYEGSTLEYIFELNQAGVEVLSMNLPFGHDWVLWRKLIVHVFDKIIWK